MSELTKLRDDLRVFSADREWDQFHSPKNLAAALSVEAAELLEHFQWLTEEQSRSVTVEARGKIADELADVLIYLVRIADKLDINLEVACKEKLAKNSLRYPIEKARGNAKKYTDL